MLTLVSIFSLYFTTAQFFHFVSASATLSVHIMTSYQPDLERLHEPNHYYYSQPIYSWELTLYNCGCAKYNVYSLYKQLVFGHD